MKFIRKRNEIRDCGEGNTWEGENEKGFKMSSVSRSHFVVCIPFLLFVCCFTFPQCPQLEHLSQTSHPFAKTPKKNEKKQALHVGWSYNSDTQGIVLHTKHKREEAKIVVHGSLTGPPLVLLPREINELQDSWTWFEWGAAALLDIPQRMEHTIFYGILEKEKKNKKRKKTPSLLPLIVYCVGTAGEIHFILLLNLFLCTPYHKKKRRERKCMEKRHTKKIKEKRKKISVKEREEEEREVENTLLRHSSPCMTRWGMGSPGGGIQFLYNKKAKSTNNFVGAGGPWSCKYNTIIQVRTKQKTNGNSKNRNSLALSLALYLLTHLKLDYSFFSLFFFLSLSSCFFLELLVVWLVFFFSFVCLFLFFFALFLSLYFFHSGEAGDGGTLCVRITSLEEDTRRSAKQKKQGGEQSGRKIVQDEKGKRVQRDVGISQRSSPSFVSPVRLSAGATTTTPEATAPDSTRRVGGGGGVLTVAPSVPYER
eukprot:gene11731-8074_t